MKLNAVELPDDLAWEDEFRWTPYPQEADHALDGALIVERGVARPAGRPVTITGDEDRAWVERPTVEALQALLAEDTMTLTLWDGRELTVGWRHEDTPFEATEVLIGSGYWFITLRLRTV